MLLLTLNIGKERYAVDANHVIEIIPLIKLDRVPRVDTCIAGIFNYRGETVPVMDLCQFFANRDCIPNLGSRIILVAISSAQGNRKIGLLAESVTEVIKCDEQDLGFSGIQSSHAQFLGRVYHYHQEIIQIIDTKKIVPDSIAHQAMTADSF
jgi:chemotaxis-related protein WspB